MLCFQFGSSGTYHQLVTKSTVCSHSLVEAMKKCQKWAVRFVKPEALSFVPICTFSTFFRTRYTMCCCCQVKELKQVKKGSENYLRKSGVDSKLLHSSFHKQRHANKWHSVCVQIRKCGVGAGLNQDLWIWDGQCAGQTHSQASHCEYLLTLHCLHDFSVHFIIASIT